MAVMLLALPVFKLQSQSFTEKMFQAGVSYDTFATATFADLKAVKSHDASFGGGIGLNAFVTKRYGVGLEAVSSTPTEGKFLDALNAKAIVRLPIAILAPSVFAGGGYNFETEKPDIFSGGGIELKVWKNAAAFGDARYVYVPAAEKGYGQARLGLRLNF